MARNKQAKAAAATKRQTVLLLSPRLGIIRFLLPGDMDSASLIGSYRLEEQGNALPV